MMTTRRFPSDDLTYKYNQTQHDDVITNKTRNGSYNIVEKDYGDHKVIYYVPLEYGDDYDVSQLDDIPINDDLPLKNSPKLTRRRIIEEYEDDDDDYDEYEYVEEMPIVKPRRRVYYSSRPRRNSPIIRKIYRSRSPIETMEYIYDNDSSDSHRYRSQPAEQLEYIVEERPRKQIYIEEPRPVRRSVYIEENPVPVSSLPPPLPPPPPPAPPVSYSPRRSPPYQVSPRPPPPPPPSINLRSASPIRTKPTARRNDPSPSLSNRKQQTPRPSVYETVKPNIPKATEPPLRLMDVIAQNRARRGARIPKPRREVDEDQVYDPPTYKRNIIKNGFIVHK